MFNKRTNLKPSHNLADSERCFYLSKRENRFVIKTYPIQLCSKMKSTLALVVQNVGIDATENKRSCD